MITVITNANIKASVFLIAVLRMFSPAEFFQMTMLRSANIKKEGAGWEEVIPVNPSKR